jgi:hypothetical protein
MSQALPARHGEFAPGCGDGEFAMARYTGPKVKLSRRVGVPIADIPKHTSKRELIYPGMHGLR